MKKIITILLVLLLTVGCSTQKELKQYQDRSTEIGFDTIITFLAYTESEKEFKQYFETVKSEFIKYNMLFDKYHDYEGVNNIKTINDNAGIAPVKVDPILMNMILLAREYTELSDGYFDITMGAVLEIWHNYQEEGKDANGRGEPGPEPDLDVLTEASQYTGWKYVEIDTENSTIYLNHERAKLDVGAIAKGYATELVSKTLEEDGLQYGIVSGGGNIRTINTKPDGSPWNIGVQRPTPNVSDDNIDVFSIKQSSSVVTSGDYQRFYTGESRPYSHLINPKTLLPDSEYKSITIFTPDSGKADILSTALYMMEYEEALDFIKLYNIEHPSEPIEAYFISDHEESWNKINEFYVTMTDNLKALSKNESK